MSPIKKTKKTTKYSSAEKWFLIGLATAILGTVVILLACFPVTVPNNRTYQAVGYSDFKPFSWQDKSSLFGLGSDLSHLIFSNLGLPVNFQAVASWPTAQEQVSSGQADFLVAARQASQADNNFIYSDPYMIDPVALFVDNGHPFSYLKWEDLIGKKGVAINGASFDDNFDSFLKSQLNITYVNSEADGFALISSGQADYFLDSYYAGANFIQTKNNQGKFFSMKPYVVTENICFAISKQSSLVSYLPAINKLIAGYKLDGTIDSLLRSNREALAIDSLKAK
jgi:ABC-type amino acid transport substrate-binding protein